MKIERVRRIAKVATVAYFVIIIGWNVAWWTTGLRSFANAHYGPAAVLWLSLVWMPLGLGFVAVLGWHLKEEAKDMRLAGDRFLQQITEIAQAALEGRLEVEITKDEQPNTALH
jgi:hypothetical protein